MNFISNFLNQFILVHLQLIEKYEQGGIQKILIIAAFVERVKTRHFEKILLINFFSIYANWFNHFIFADFLLIDGYQQRKERKGTGHCCFHRVVVNNYLEKDLLETSISTQINLVNHFIFDHFLLIEDYQKDVLRKEEVIATFIK